MRRVRSGFWVALAIALVVTAHAYWDFFESRRLRSRLESVSASGAPTRLTTTVRLTGAAADADRYYRAAAVLGGRAWESIPPSVEFAMRTAVRDSQWTPAFLADVRSSLETQREALSLIDRASVLPFDGFEGPGVNNYGAGAFMALSRLCEMRALERVLSGDSDGAFDSLYSDVRLERVMLRPPLFRPLEFIVKTAKPSAAARARLAQALADIDRDDRMQQSFIRLRAQLLDARWQMSQAWPWIVRPWLSHGFVTQLDTFGELIAAAGTPPAGRVDAVMAVGRWPAPPPFPTTGERARATLEVFTKGTILEMERVRCARRLVAGEMVNCLR